jgi:hypothetical protein
MSGSLQTQGRVLADGSRPGVTTAIPPVAQPVAAASLTIAAGGTAQQLFAANTILLGYRVQNPSTATESLFVDDSGNPATTTSGTTIELQAGQFYESPFAVATSVSVLAATTGHPFKAARY